MIFCPLDVLEDSVVSITPAQFVSTACRRDFTYVSPYLGRGDSQPYRLNYFPFHQTFRQLSVKTQGSERYLSLPINQFQIITMKTLSKLDTHLSHCPFWGIEALRVIEGL